jgi:DNA-binding MurR/RpiR family transcriptional regulator
LLIKKLGYEGWKQLKYVGRRWIAEIVFSSIKRVLGENLLSKKFKAQKVEASMKILSIVSWYSIYPSSRS